MGEITASYRFSQINKILIFKDQDKEKRLLATTPFFSEKGSV